MPNTRLIALLQQRTDAELVRHFDKWPNKVYTAQNDKRKDEEDRSHVRVLFLSSPPIGLRILPFAASSVLSHGAEIAPRTLLTSSYHDILTRRQHLQWSVEITATSGEWNLLGSPAITVTTWGEPPFAGMKSSVEARRERVPFLTPQGHLHAEIRDTHPLWLLFCFWV